MRLSRRPLVALTLLATILFAPLASEARAQGGYTAEKHPDLGITFPRARDYEQIPTQPDEPFIVLLFAEKISEGARAPQRKYRPELNVVWIDFVPDAPVATGESGTAPAPLDGEKKSEGQAKKPVNSIERWFEQRVGAFRLGQAVDGKAREGYACRQYSLSPQKSARGLAGWACVYTKLERTIAFVGICAEGDLVEQVKIWRGSAEKVDFDEPEELSLAKLERKYAGSKWSHPEFRIDVRKKLVRGWKGEDLENYIVIYDSPDQPMMRKVFNDIELVRKEYQKLFPSVEPVTAVSTVRVCKSRDEYLSYGGMPGSAGYWNYATEELVLYDAEKITKNNVVTDADTFIVLYHEAFHQYIHYSTGELPPHSWFNEGHGDFFSGAKVSDGKLRKIGVNPWRVRTIQEAIERGDSIPWDEIVKYEQSKFYEPAKRHICYAQGWSMIYFLRTSKAVEKNAAWARILPTYFDVLKLSYKEELAKLDASKKDDKAERFKAGLVARTKAVDAAFVGVDMAAIERAWRDYTLSLAVPKE